MEGLNLGSDESVRDLADSLSQSCRLEVSELSTGLSIRAFSYVGTIRLGNIQITIHPKIPTFISMIIGIVLGLISGYYGGKTDSIIMRIADIVLAFPSLLLAMVFMYTLGASLLNIFIALSLVRCASISRVVRSQTLSLKEMES